MKELYPSISLEVLSGLFGITRQAYNKHSQLKVTEVFQQDIILDLVKKVRQRLHSCGGRLLLDKIKEGLDAHNLHIGRDAFFNFLSNNGLLLKKRKRKVYTTNSNHWFKKYPNLLLDSFVPNRAGELWVSDITYLRVGDRFVYLALITDAYSRKIVGYCLSESLHADLCVKALKMAIESNEISSDLIHHSDRGIQYCSAKYIKILNKKGIRISMTQNGSPYDNALAERVNGILKNDIIPKSVLESFKEALKAVETSIETYNNYRPHLSCDKLTPKEAHTRQGPLKKHWKNYKRYKRQDDKHST